MMSVYKVHSNGRCVNPEQKYYKYEKYFTLVFIPSVSDS